MDIKNVKDYLAGHAVVEIKVGKSGADVYDIDGKYILKHVLREKLEDSLFNAYLREAYFYQSDGENKKIYRPKILQVNISEDEVVLLMKKYDQIERSELNDELLQKIMAVLARVHTDWIPDFLRQEKEKAQLLTASRIRECLDGWKSVLAEHPKAFDIRPLYKLADRINDIILWHDGEKRVLSHGDFHWDNLLMDENGEIVICDWQGVGEGTAAGDLSFFISRLSADGVQIDERKLLDYYTVSVYTLSGKQVSQEELSAHMVASNTITSFLFWHEYLHGSSEERVREIYGHMVSLFL